MRKSLSEDVPKDFAAYFCLLAKMLAYVRVEMYFLKKDVFSG